MKHYNAFNIPTMQKINALPKRYNAVSLFAGCGGSSVGLKLARYDVRYANEFVPIAAKTYKLNAPNTYVDTKDVRKITAKRVLRLAKLQPGELDLLDFSPPCKMYSRASLASRKDKRADEVVLYSEGIKQRVDDLFDNAARLLKKLQPKVFTAENVPGLIAGNNKGYFAEIHASLTACGYEVSAAIINAGQLGVPQNRRRLIFIGVRNDLVKKRFHPVFPTPLAQVISVRDVLPHIRRMKMGGSKGYVSTTRPSPTITATDATNSQTGEMSCGGWIEDETGELRKYNIKELKKVFAFPADFKLIGKFEQRWERIGRSHAPLAMYYIGSTIAEMILDKIAKKGTSHASKIHRKARSTSR